MILMKYISKLIPYKLKAIITSKFNPYAKKTAYLERKLVSLLYSKALESSKTSSGKVVPKSVEEDLIVTLTTYSSRISTVHIAIESILNQTLRPSKVILWLDEAEFTIDSLPELLLEQTSRGLDIKFCPNYKSYKKIIPALELYKGYILVTADDDIFYPHSWLEELYLAYKKEPHVIHAHRIHKMRVNSLGKLKKYNEWEFESKFIEASHLCFPTSGAGVLYPPGSFTIEVLNSTVFMSICPSADDVWLKAMLLLNNIKCKKVESDTMDYLLTLDGTQEISLYEENHLNGANDTQLSKVFTKYNLYKLLSENTK